MNRKLANALVRLAPDELEMAEISFKDLPLYSYDYDADFPPVARAFKDAIANVDAILFVTPEYNRSIPGGLKNAIDWGSRPYGRNSFTRKPSAVIGASPGSIGTALAQQSLRGVLSFCNSPQMNAPEAYIHFTSGLITDDGRGYGGVDRGIPAQLHGRISHLHYESPSGAPGKNLTPQLLRGPEDPVRVNIFIMKLLQAGASAFPTILPRAVRLRRGTYESRLAFCFR